MTEGPESVAAVDQLIQDTQLMSDARPPIAIAEDWSNAVAEYATQLNELRVAKSNGGPAAGAIASANSALEALRILVGL